MNKYSKTSLANLKSCHEDLQRIFEELLPYQDHTIICGHRGEKEQTKAFLENKSRLMYPQSKHNSKPSEAADVAPYHPKQGLEWEDIKAMCFFAGRVVQKAHELHQRGQIDHLLRWGGDWDQDGSTSDQTFNDLVHFELVKPK